MRAALMMIGVGVMLAACAPAPKPVQVSVFSKSVQPRAAATIAAPVVATQTTRVIRPDATGHFPGDYAAAWNAKPAYEAAHIGAGSGTRAGGVAVAPVGKYTPAPSGKYTPPGKYTPVAGVPVAGSVAAGAAWSGAVAGRRPVPGHSAYEAHRVYRPPMDCYIISQAKPEPWVGQRYACVEH